MHMILLRCLAIGVFQFIPVFTGVLTTIAPFNQSVFETVLNISENRVTWNTAIRSGDRLVSKDIISKYGWDFIQDNIPKFETVWLPARAIQTPFVSWEGCAKWTGGPDCNHSVLAGGSIGDCLRNCRDHDHFLLLKGTDCRCVPRQNISKCFTRTTDRCDAPCHNNPNDWCGGPNNSMALYRTGPFGKNNTETKDKETNGSMMSCMVYINSKLQESTCNITARRYICGDGSNYSRIDNVEFIEWREALHLCNLSKKHLYFKIDDKNDSRTALWTSIKRSIELEWTTKSDDDFSLCVSATKDNASNLLLAEDVCTHKYKYLLLQNLQKDVKTQADDESLMPFRQLYIYVGLAVLLLVALPVVIALLCRIVRKNRSNSAAVNTKKKETQGHQLSATSTKANEYSVPVDEVQEVYNYVRAEDFRNETGNEAPAHTYHTFASAAAASGNQSVYNTMSPKNGSLTITCELYYDHAGTGRRLGENESFYNVCGEQNPVPKDHLSDYDTAHF